MPVAEADATVARAIGGLIQLCLETGIDDSHGAGHAAAVLHHAEAAVAAAAQPLSEARALAVRLAALLHDADDKKYFPKTCRTYANARQIMSDAGAAPAVVEDALRMISLVSCSSNGNAAPPEARTSPELLWPRWADRLEASGEVGVVRCYQYNRHVGAPLSVDQTPRPATQEEVWRHATEERFEEYQASGGGSASMIDHYYDKLLHVARPPPRLVQNRYLEEEAEARVAPLVEVCLAFGEAGEVPLGLITEMERRLATA